MNCQFLIGTRAAARRQREVILRRGRGIDLADLTGAVVHAKSILAANTEGFWIKASGGLSHDLFLNAADAWDDVSAVAPLLFTGTISFRWRLIT